MLKHRELSRRIIRGFYDVYNELGTGFLESVYENSLYWALRNRGLEVKKQYPLAVYFREKKVGDYKADLIVENIILVELKAVAQLSAEHEAQIINYLKATDINFGLLMNFGISLNSSDSHLNIKETNRSALIRVYPRRYIPVNTIFPVFLLLLMRWWASSVSVQL